MTEVFLHVYDVANTHSVTTNNAIIHLNKFFKDGFRLGGVFHSAVQVYGQREWSFGYCESSNTGIFSCSPKQNSMYLYRESISLGHTTLSPSKVKEIVTEMRKEWPGNAYDVLSRNCNHFCNDFCVRLGVQKPPAWVNRFANAGETAMGVAETTLKLVKQAKAEMVWASKVAYHLLFSAATTSTVSPEPSEAGGLLLESPRSTDSSPSSRKKMNAAGKTKNEASSLKFPLLKSQTGFLENAISDPLTKKKKNATGRNEASP